MYFRPYRCPGSLVSGNDGLAPTGKDLNVLFKERDDRCAGLEHSRHQSLAIPRGSGDRNNANIRVVGPEDWRVAFMASVDEEDLKAW